MYSLLSLIESGSFVLVSNMIPGHKEVIRTAKFVVFLCAGAFYNETQKGKHSVVNFSPVHVTLKILVDDLRLSGTFTCYQFQYLFLSLPTLFSFFPFCQGPQHKHFVRILRFKNFHIGALAWTFLNVHGFEKVINTVLDQTFVMLVLPSLRLQDILGFSPRNRTVRRTFLPQYNFFRRNRLFWLSNSIMAVQLLLVFEKHFHDKLFQIQIHNVKNWIS